MLWNDAQQVLGPQINKLDPVRFADLCNQLLSETAGRHNIPRSCMVTNLRITEPDGGIDASCVHSPYTSGQLIPKNNVIYQYKSGSENRSAAQIIGDDILAKPRVMQALEDGKTLVYMAGWDRGDKFSDDVIEKAKKDHSLDLKDKFIFIGSDVIARLLGPLPALAAACLNVDMGGIASLREWSQQPVYSNAFQVDSLLTDQMNDLRRSIEVQGSRLRIVGSAGNGKTRRVLEALRNSPLANTVLYAAQFSYLSPAFLRHVSQTSDVECTFVVDEVNDIDAERLLGQFSTMPSGVRLIMIGLDASGCAPSGTLQVEGLSTDLLARTITSIVPGVASEQAASIANVCEGSPKLAVLIARRIEEDPNLTSNRQLLADGTVQSALDRFLGIDDKSEEWQALSLVALVVRVGWIEPVAHESEHLFQAAGLNPITSRARVESLHKRMGIAPLAGSYRYISPTILANYLAARQLSLWTRDLLAKFLSEITTQMQQSLALRVRETSHVLKENRGVVEEVILGDQGPFRTLNDLEHSGASALIRHLAAPFPLATLHALERIIGQATPEALQADRKSRRDCVWALEQLLWPSTTFQRAAALLFKLALAENENWENNASNTWTSTFQTQLGRTAAGLQPRAKTLRIASHSDEPRARTLAAVALGAALNMGHSHRAGTPPTEFEGMPEEAWFPQTWGEWTEAFFTYLDILNPLLSDSDAGVRDEAANSFAKALHAALLLPQTSKIQQEPLDVWLRAAQNFVGEPFEQRETLIDAIELQKEMWEHRLESAEGKELSISDRENWYNKLAELAALVRDLEGQDFTSRFRAALVRPARPRHHDESDEEVVRRQHELELLAADVLAQPALLNEQFSWMLKLESSRHWFIWSFFSILGRLDKERSVSATILTTAAQTPQAIMWHSMYQIAWADTADIPNFIDDYLIKLRRDDAPVALTFDLIMRSGYSPSRMELVTSMIRDKELAPIAVSSLAYHPWGVKIPVDAVSTVIGTVLSTASEESISSATPALVQFLQAYLRQNRDAKKHLQEMCLHVLTLTGDRASSGDWAWSELARLYISDDPLKIAVAALQRMRKGGIHSEGRLRELIEEAWRIGDKKTLFEQAIAPAIVRSDDEEYTTDFWTVREGLKGFPLDEVGVEFLMEWMRGLPERRPLALAEVLGAPTHKVSNLHAVLLEEYAEEGVSSSFYGAYASGGWMGNMTDWLQEKIKMATEWTKDERPTVRSWASMVLKGLQSSYDDARKREEEEAQMRKYYQ